MIADRVGSILVSPLTYFSSITRSALPTCTLFPYTTLFRSPQRQGRPLPRRLKGPPAPATRELAAGPCRGPSLYPPRAHRSEEHTSELQSLRHLVCRLLLEKKKLYTII